MGNSHDGICERLEDAHPIPSHLLESSSARLRVDKGREDGYPAETIRALKEEDYDSGGVDSLVNNSISPTR